ncbi:unnamed protein product [Effrenium voratum]|uniref:Prolyl 4-hydroxylase alpha subunit domain-containing protein n=1 Tax=Effrenium voratum TaxID=2562239 RepID=A0AA36MU09_9DINO|nr:unnamed protein product [Effrenium voratum]CAJ1417383.1 unnamed protein product [Effrenium voratum]
MRSDCKVRQLGSESLASEQPTFPVCQSNCQDAASWLRGMQKSAVLACLAASRKRHRQARVAQRGRGFGGDAISSSRRSPQISPAKPTTEDFARSESEVAKFKQEVMGSMDEWCDDLIEGLRDRGWWASSEPVLPLGMRSSMRQEVETLWKEGQFIQSQSVLGGTVYYDKKHVFATEVTSERYLLCPRMWHYTVAVTQELVRRVNLAFPSMGLSDKFIGNKLNMSVGKGAAFDPHLDVGVAEKPFDRKLSLLMYLNDSWRPALGGEIVLLGEGQTEAEAARANPENLGLPVTLPPTSGRLVAFWSDRILHKVQASEVLNGIKDYRCSYVIWLLGQGDNSPSQSSDGQAESAPSWAL